MIEKTLVLIKPDGVRRGLVGDIITRFERKGLKIVKMVLYHVSEFVAKKHYAEHAEKPRFVGLVEHLISGPSVIMTLEGDNAIRRVRDLVGPWKDPSAGTIRGDFGREVPDNVIHASDSLEAAEREIQLYFGVI